MGKSKKIDLLAAILFGVLAVCLVMVIVGICIDWTSSTVKVSNILGGGSSTTKASLADWAESNGKTEGGIEGYGVMAAFAYITLVLSILTTIAYVLSKFIDVKVMKWVVLGLAVLLVVSAIVTIATTYGFCGDGAKGYVLSAETVPAAGAWLLTVFAILGGAAGAVGALKK